MARRMAVVVAGALLAGWVSAQGPNPVLDVFKAQLEMEHKLLNLDLARLDRVQEQLKAATDRLVRLNDDLLRAEREGEDVEGYVARSNDIRVAEGTVKELIDGAAQLRATMGARRGTAELLQAEVARLAGTGQATQDEVSGTWAVSIEPGGMKGTFDLRLDGTLISGVYQLSGGWKGSLRGTFIGGNIRLERIDSQLGLAAVYTGRLVTRDGERRIEGQWESTNLADGLPGSGTWVARKEPRS